MFSTERKDGMLFCGDIHPTSHLSGFWVGCNSIKRCSFILRRKLFFPFLYQLDMKGCRNTGRKTLWKGGMHFQQSTSFHPLCAIGKSSSWWLKVRGFNSKWPHSKGHSSTVRSVNETENVQLPQVYPSPDAVINFVVTWAHSGDHRYPPWNKQYVCVCGTRTPWGPRASMWQGVTPHSRLGFLVSLPHCTPLPGPGWQMVKDNVSTWESNTLRDWECVKGSATSYRDPLKNRNINCCWVMGTLNSTQIRNRDTSAEYQLCNFF